MKVVFCLIQSKYTNVNVIYIDNCEDLEGFLCQLIHQYGTAKLPTRIESTMEVLAEIHLPLRQDDLVSIIYISTNIFRLPK